MKLYFVACNDEEDNYDLFVWASSPPEARKLHSAYYGDAFDDVKSDVFIVPTEPPATPKAVMWHDEILTA